MSNRKICPDCLKTFKSLVVYAHHEEHNMLNLVLKMVQGYTFSILAPPPGRGGGGILTLEKRWRVTEKKGKKDPRAGGGWIFTPEKRWKVTEKKGKKDKKKGGKEEKGKKGRNNYQYQGKESYSEGSKRYDFLGKFRPLKRLGIPSIHNN